MMKKIAYIGGYLSALCLAMALLMGALTFQERINSTLNGELASAQETLAMFSNNELDRTAMYIEYYQAMEASKIAVMQNLDTIQALIIAAIVIFCLSYLPYRFYIGYQRCQLEFNSI